MEERIFEIGDRVMLNPEVVNFTHGQGPVSYDEVGTVSGVYNGGSLEVDFPSMCSWWGETDDLIRAGEIECHDCHEVHKFDEMTKVYYGNRNVFLVCKNCEENYSICDDCGRRCTDNYICEHCGNTVCGKCFEAYKPKLYDYHEFNSWKLFKGKNEENPPYYIGKEIEIEGGDRDDALEIIYNNINAVAMKDSSLGYGGVECVTHPESWKYLQEHKDNYRNFFDKIEEVGYGNEGSCGLHFHVTRPNDDVISRIIVLLESFKNEIKKLSRREDNQLEEWSKFLSDTCYSSDKKDKIKYQSTKFLKEKYISSYHDRYMALNLNNAQTIEFRFFNGANNFEEFWGALQFIHNLMEIAMDENKDINTVYWKDLIIGEEVKSQARRYGVADVDKKAKDTTEIMEKIEKQAEKAIKDIQRILKNLTRCINKNMSELTLNSLKERDLTKMLDKSNEFMKSFKYTQDYLQRIISLYGYINGNNFNIAQIKDYLKSTESSYPTHSKRYSRYNKMIEKVIKDYESEEI